MLPNTQTPRYRLQIIWRDLPTHKKQKVIESVDVTRQTVWRWVNDPAAITLSQAAKLCALLDIENPLTFITPV